MLTCAVSDTQYRCIGIDPGTDHFGIAVLSMDLIHHTLWVDEAFSLKGRQLGDQSFQSEVLGPRGSRIEALSTAFSSVLHHHRPQAIISEAPYMGRFPSAYGSLVECLAMIRRCVYQYDPGLTFQTIDPASAKTTLEVFGRSAQKRDIYEAIKHRSTVHWHRPSLIEQLDEHALDAVLMGCAFFKRVGYCI